MNTKQCKAITILIIISTLTAIAASSLSLVAAATSSEWPMWRADAAHSSTGAEGPTTLALAWNYSTQGAVISSPSIVDDVVYVGSQDKNIYAVGAFNGSLIWKFATQDAVVSSPAVVNGKVYTGGDDGYVYCLDAYTGRLLWQTFVNGDLEYTWGSLVLKSSPAVVDGIVYVGSLDGYLYAINADSGSIVWKYNSSGYILSSPAVSDGAVYFTSEQATTGVLFKLDAKSGSLLWSLPIPFEHQFTGGTEMMGSPSVADGMVFVPADLRTYYGVNAQTGTVVWYLTDPSAAEFIVSCPLYADGQLFIIDKYSITSLNPTNGHTNWSFFTGDELYTSLSYAAGKLYLMTSQRHLYVLDTATNGTKLSMFNTESGSWSSPSIAYGRIYIGNHDWNVYCFVDTTTTNPEPTPTPPVNIIIPSDYTIAIVVFVVIVAVAAVVVAVSLRRKRKKPL
jgi:eukaryotic-like serine/threonine-protein kinase